jgi:TonB family protein
VSFPRAEYSRVEIRDLNRRARARGMDFGAQVAAAVAGDREALDSVLAVAAWVGGDSLHPLPTYPMVLQGLLETVGDGPFNSALLHLSATARRNAVSLVMAGGLVDRQRFPLVWMLDSSQALQRQNRSVGEAGGDSLAVTALPVLVHRSCTPPRFPTSRGMRDWAGHVQLEFVIGADGRVERRSIRVLATVHPDFVPLASDLAMSCRYQPGRINDRPVRVRVQQPLNFRSGR